MFNLLRSIAFNVLFYLNTVVWLIIALPTFFMPYQAILEIAKTWGRINLLLLRFVAGIDYEIRGREKFRAGRSSSPPSTSRPGKSSPCCRCSAVRPSS